MLKKLESATPPRVVQPSEQVVPDQPQGQLPLQEQVEVASSSTTGQLLNSSKAINPVFTAQQAIKSEVAQEQALVLLKTVKEEKNSCQKDFDEASKLTMSTCKEIHDFVLPHLHDAFKDLFSDEKNTSNRINQITRYVFREPAEKRMNVDISGLDKNGKEQFFTLIKKADEVRKKWEEAEQSSQIVCQKVRRYFERVKNEYASAVDLLRLDMPKERQNVRVLAAASQLSAAANPTTEECEENKKSGRKNLSLHTTRLSNALKATGSMDEAIDQVCRDVCVHGDGVDLSIQKAVSSKNEIGNAWRKSENGNPNVRRIVISIVAEDGYGLQKNNANEILGYYRKQSVAEYNADSNEEKYRVDNIIEVFRPTEEEEKAGITFEEKIKNAFKQARAFAEEQKGQSSGQELKFEGVAHWDGHGGSYVIPENENIDLETASSDKETKPKDDFREGSRDFLFIIEHDHVNGKHKGMDKASIKILEKELTDVGYKLIQDFGLCCSGAIIA